MISFQCADPPGFNGCEILPGISLLVDKAKASFHTLQVGFPILRVEALISQVEILEFRVGAFYFLRSVREYLSSLHFPWEFLYLGHA